MNDATQAHSKRSESERVAEVVHEALDRFTTQAAEAEKRVREAADDAQQRLQSSKHRVREKGRETANVIEEYVDEHPWTSLGVAFGAGIILSSLLRR
jgi:ElaB/YqjD/DUF883 family membrane-anchored ribosome-binding protein